jgi:predicted nucleotidyltransferase
LRDDSAGYFRGGAVMLDEQNWIIDTLHHSPCIELAWLYGSRATNKQSDNSDYDIAVALRPGVTDNFEIIDEIQYKLAGGLDVAISLVDINRIPVPLAYNIVAQGKVLLCHSDFRLRLEQQRIWSLWEEYKYQYEHHRKTI